MKTVASASNGSLKTTARASAAGSRRFVYTGSGSVAGSVAAADHVAVK